MITQYVVCGIVSYLVGAVPFGFLIARAKGVDIRTVGSGNIGATNVLRALGKRWGIFTFFLDVAKGFLSAAVIPLLASCVIDAESSSQGLKIISACCAVAGHNWPVYLCFKGGKGIATTAGALLAIAPIALGAGFIAWFICFSVFRYVSLASIVGAAVIPAVGWFVYRGAGLTVPVFLIMLGALGIFRHRANIVRLLNGTESKFERKKK